MKNEKVKILIVGQTPPPYGGQALMIDYMLNADFENIKLYHVRMNFSREMNERGKMSLYKITHLISIIVNTIYLKFKYGISTLYYPPSNSPHVSVLRDLIFLAFTRFFFKKTIFHFHAAGISEYIPGMSPLLRKIAFFILKEPDLAITSSVYNPKDAEFLKAKKIEIIPLGIPDVLYENKTLSDVKQNKSLTVLFVGLLNSTKGEGFLLDAIANLNKKGYNVNLKIAGKFETDDYKEAFYAKISNYKIENKVEYLGVIVGEAKVQAFINADLFCFPSFFVSESFGMVLLEAMLFGLPVISTKWRGIQSIVEEGRNGFLVDIKNAEQISDKIQLLFENPQLLKQMGTESRNLYLEKYTLSAYIKNMEKTFLKI